MRDSVGNRVIETKFIVNELNRSVTAEVEHIHYTLDANNIFYPETITLRINGKT